MPRAALDRLEEWKSRFGSPDTGRLEKLLRSLAGRGFRTADDLIRLHEAALFFRAYPPSAAAARLADAILFSFGRRIAGFTARGGDATAFEEPEISGIAGTSLSAAFSWDVVRRLVSRHPRELEIGWDRADEPDRLAPATSRILPLLDEEWPVEAHTAQREWIGAATPPGESELAWLVERFERLPAAPRDRADLFAAMELPVTWRLGNSDASRSRLRLGRRRLFFHREPLLRRRDVSLERELAAPPLAVRRLARPEAREVLDLILDTSAVRFRELYGFSFPDGNGVFHARAGRGVDIYFFGVPPGRRLPLRAYHGGMFFKNGVPAGYVELLSFFERAEVGFNLYYTFRDGESAWLYARLLRLFRQVLGVTTFSIDPYQVGHENPEAIDSGAFWFYRKLGFRPASRGAARVLAREEERIGRVPQHRSSRRTLEKLAEGPMLYDGSPASGGAWDEFRIGNIGLAVQRIMAERFGGDPDRLRRAATSRAKRVLGIESAGGLALVLGLVPGLEQWTGEEKRAAQAIVRAKEHAAEARYLRLMQGHPRMRSAFLALGSFTTRNNTPRP